MAPAATRMTCSRWERPWRRAPPSSAHGGRCSRTACRGSSVAGRGTFRCRRHQASSWRAGRFISQARTGYELGDVPPIAVGFSNGANIAAALLLLHPSSLSGGFLLAPWCRWYRSRCRNMAGPGSDRRRPARPDRSAGSSQALADLLGSGRGGGHPALEHGRP